MKQKIAQVLRPVRALPFKVARTGLRGMNITIPVATGAKVGDKFWIYAASDGTVILSPREVKT